MGFFDHAEICLRSAHQAVVLVLEGTHHRGHVLLQLVDVLAVGRVALLVGLGLLVFGSRLQLGLVDGELDGGCGRLGAQVVHA